MSAVFCLSRREFLKLTGMAGTGLVLGFPWRSSGAAAGVFQPSVYLLLDPLEGVKVLIPAPEVGQNIRTALAMALADELDFPLDRLAVIQAPPDEKFGHQVTGGSRGIRTHFETFREAGAMAREMLVKAAAKRWNCKPADCRAVDGSVVHTDGRNLAYLELAEEAAELPLPASPVLKDPSEARYIGKDIVSLEAEAIVTGKERFGLDAQVEGCLYAACVRPPVQDAKLVGFDAVKALAFPGVKDVMEVDGRVAVFALDTWTALEAAELVEADWDIPARNKVSQDELRRSFSEALDDGGKLMEEKGEPDRVFGTAAVQVRMDRFAPCIAHAVMEPPNCTAWVRNDRADIWLAAQNYNAARSSLPKWTGLPAERITVHPLRVGGGFGRKLRLEYVEEAIALSRAVQVPVQVVYSRKDDLRCGTFRHPMAFRLEAGLDAKGRPEAFRFTTAGEVGDRYAEDYLVLAPNRTFRAAKVDVPLWFGPLRAPGHNARIFAWEGFVDGLAGRVGVDPLDYRLALYGDSETLAKLGWDAPAVNRPKLVQLLRMVREQSGWGRDPGSVYGVATFEGYGSRIALVVQLSRKPGRRAAEKVFAAVDCGRVVSPWGAKAQVEGGIMDAIGVALRQQITLDEGKVQQSGFDDFPLLRISEAPDVDVQFVESLDTAQGLGEVAYPPAVAAFANAVAARDGKPVEALPIYPG